MDPIKNAGAVDYAMTVPQNQNQVEGYGDYSSMPMVYEPEVEQKKKASSNMLGMAALGAVALGTAIYAANKSGKIKDLKFQNDELTVKNQDLKNKLDAAEKKIEELTPKSFKEKLKEFPNVKYIHNNHDNIKEIIEEIPQYKVNKIANEIAIRITNVFTELKDQHDDLLKKLEQCKIKIAKFEDENISHYYSNGVIYFSNKIHTNSINEILVIEYLHFLQDGRDQTCFQESLNNFAAKLLTQELKERMNVFGIFLSSLIEGDYALLVNLIMQIDFLVGRKEFVETVINNKDDYYVLINKILNGNIDRLTGDFKKLYYLILDYKTTDDLYKVEQEIKEMYLKAYYGE